MGLYWGILETITVTVTGEAWALSQQVYGVLKHGLARQLSSRRIGLAAEQLDAVPSANLEVRDMDLPQPAVAPNVLWSPPDLGEPCYCPDCT